MHMKDLRQKDQADQLREKVQSDRDDFEWNTSSLPSRKEVHSRKKQKVKMKIKFPLVKLLALFFVLLVITTFAIYSFLTKDDEPSKKASGNEDSYSEKIIINHSSSDKKAVKEEASEPKKQKEEAKAPEKNETAVSESKDQEQNKETEKAPEKAPDQDQTDAGQKQPVTIKPEKKEVASGTAGKESNPENNPAENSHYTMENGYKVYKHTVQPKETVFRIAMNYYKSQAGIELIKQWNGLADNNISVGQVLKIPVKP